MRELSIPPSNVSPAIRFEAEVKTVIVEGQCFPENALGFFEPVVDWLQDYFTGEPKELLLSVRLLYLNTSSFGVFRSVLAVLEAAHKAGAAARVEWFFDVENETALELGQEYQIDVAVPFLMKETPRRRR